MGEWVRDDRLHRGALGFNDPHSWKEKDRKLGLVAKGGAA